MYIDPKVVGVGILEKDHKILLVKRGIEPGYGKRIKRRMWNRS